MSELYTDLTLTNFPKEVDSFLTYVNIVADDGPKVKQYIDAMNSGNQSLATQILQTIPSANQKIIKATDLNKLTQAVQAVERFYKTDVEPYINQKQQEWEGIINQFSYQGTWLPTKSYVTNNMVTYILNGANLIYIATSTPPSGNPPTDSKYWRLLTIQGEKGEPGEGSTYSGQWAGNINYVTNQSVTHNGIIWMSLKNNYGVEPGTDGTTWRKVVSIVASYPIQENEPSGQSVGALWFNTSNNPTKYYHLKPLNNPATANNVETGFQVYDENGKIITGTMQKLVMTGLEVTAPPSKIDYSVGETFDPTGMVITANFTNGYKAIINGYTFNPSTPLQENDTTITINYANFGTTVSTTLNIKVSLADPILENNSWETISKIAKQGKAKDIWKVGDTKSILFNGEQYYVQIIGFDHDDVTDAQSYGRNKAGITFQFGVANDSTRNGMYGTIYYMNSSETNSGGWPGSYMCKTVMPQMKGYLPADCQSKLVKVNKLTSAGGASSTINTSSDDLFLLSEIEIFGSTACSVAGEGTQYAFYKNGNSKVRYRNGSTYDWWERSPSSGADYGYYFGTVSAAGLSDFNNADIKFGVSFGFCV